MRARDGALGPADDVVSVTFEGRVIPARRGETVAAALSAAGVIAFRETATGAERGLFCGMGVCQDCLVEIDGVPGQPACMTRVASDIAVRRQRHPPALPPVAEAAAAPAPAVDPEPDLLVLGGGAGGLNAAAVAAEAGLTVVLVDERPAPGGQYFKQPGTGLRLSAAVLADPQFTGGRALLERARAAGVTILRGMAVSAAAPRQVAVALGDAVVTLRPKRLVVATGAYERPHAVPGWTRPGVMTTGALQTLLRSYRVVPGRRVLIAGNGPLNLQVALELTQAGADVVGVAEASPGPRPAMLGTLARMALAAPGLTRQGAATLAGLRRHGVPVHWGMTLTGVDRDGEGLRARLTSAGSPGVPRDVATDIVALGHGFLPADEVLRLIGAAQEWDPRRRQRITRRDEAMQTSIEGVHAVGDCCGLGGAPAAQAEGVIAGCAVAVSLGRTLAPALAAEAEAARAALGRHLRFQKALWTLFAADPPDPSAATAETVICRCEEVTLAEIDAAIASGATDVGSLKRMTRLGMGACQGRYCSEAAATRLLGPGTALAAGSFYAPRPPIRPVPLGRFVAGGCHAPADPLPDADR
jgi:NADPH-dependent 2,4-dienoyl-CoA reductase/sulfur reductase-like enzyme